QPNLSTALLVSLIVVTIYYLSGGEVKELFILSAVATFLSILLIIISPYRFSRLHTLLDPNGNSTTAYHTNQIVISLASGGLFGKGLANSDQKYKYLPKLATDSILAVIGEETGFIGLTSILLIYLYLIVYLLKLSQSLHDSFSSLVVSGVAAWISYQSLINISAIAAIIPLTGVPLPFISYGGSSLFTLLTAIGLVRNIEKHHYQLVYSTDGSKEHQNNRHHRNPPHSGPGTDQTASQ
ncbi:MAG TPA: FtsW/RodA/SpoVE family cell cycle protein, partial [Patescibacteria group bacterium]